ncbi:MAG: phytanoyl-CoA dioxygenase family protein [Candidatus Parabeggiatoa sp.]|nr:phytanoyl-CoA dioxygenase family protein [Candidatus Parabeggiatoa sp.]
MMSQLEEVYASRTGENEIILPRPDPVVYGGGQKKGQHALNQAQLDFYDENGFLILESYMPEIVDNIIAETERLRYVLKGRDELITEPDSDELRSIFKPQAFSEVIDRFSRDARMLDIVTQILDSEVYIHQSRINLKPALRGKSFPWHSDFETWHVEDGMPKPRALSAWIMLTENNEYNGPLYVVPGSHKHYVSCAGKTPDKNYQQSLKKQTYGTPSFAALKALTKEKGIRGVYGSPGTVVFHESNILHGSPDNISVWARMNLFFVYNSVHNCPVNGVQVPRPEYICNQDCSALQPI